MKIKIRRLKNLKINDVIKNIEENEINDYIIIESKEPIFKANHYKSIEWKKIESDLNFEYYEQSLKERINS